MAEQLITLKNNELKVTLSSKGAEIVSIIKDGKEKIWQADPEVWPMHTPIMFPVCGGLKDDEFIFEGKTYNLGKHGFIRFCEFEVESADDEKVVFAYTSNEETLKQYPFDFKFKVAFTLKGADLLVEYITENTGDKAMYFSAGAHEGYACNEGVENYTIVFEKEEDLVSNVLEGNLLGYNTVELGKGTKELKLKDEFFKVDALVFLNLKSRKVWLRNDTTGESFSVSFDGADYLLLWTKYKAKYICIEPWFGISDFTDSNKDFVNKRGITKLGVGEVCVNTHTISF